jgi:hypothetical protein
VLGDCDENRVQHGLLICIRDLPGDQEKEIGSEIDLAD